MRNTLIIVFTVVVLFVALYHFLIGNFRKPEPEIVKFNEPIKVIGLEIKTNDKDIYKDVGRVASQFNAIKEKSPIPNLKKPWASINISKDYDPQAGTFVYIVGDEVTEADSVPDGLKTYEVPAITYAVFTIKPKSKLAWGITMGRTKRFIYTEWLPQSGYKPSDIIGDFELHDDRSLGRHPQISLYVALKE